MSSAKKWSNVKCQCVDEKCYKMNEAQDARFGDIYLMTLKGKSKIPTMFKKTYTTNSEKDALKKIEVMAARQKLAHKNMSRLHGWGCTKVSEWCSTHYEIFAYYDYPSSCARTWTDSAGKKDGLKPVTHKDLTYMVYQVLEVVDYLNSMCLNYQDIRPTHIGIRNFDKSEYELVDRLKYPMEAEDVNRNHLVNGQYLYCSPLVFEACVNKASKNAKDCREKSDVFSVGMTALALGLDHDVQECYDVKNKKFNDDKKRQYFHDFERKYQHENKLLCDIVQHCLEICEHDRFTAHELLDRLEPYNRVADFLCGTHTMSHHEPVCHDEIIVESHRPTIEVEHHAPVVHHEPVVHHHAPVVHHEPVVQHHHHAEPVRHHEPVVQHHHHAEPVVQHHHHAEPTKVVSTSVVRGEPKVERCVADVEVRREVVRLEPKVIRQEYNPHEHDHHVVEAHHAPAQSHHHHEVVQRVEPAHHHQEVVHHAPAQSHHHHEVVQRVEPAHHHHEVVKRVEPVHHHAPVVHHEPVVHHHAEPVRHHEPVVQQHHHHEVVAEPVRVVQQHHHHEVVAEPVRVVQGHHHHSNVVTSEVRRSARHVVATDSHSHAVRREAPVTTHAHGTSNVIRRSHAGETVVRTSHAEGARRVVAGDAHAHGNAVRRVEAPTSHAHAHEGVVRRVEAPTSHAHAHEGTVRRVEPTTSHGHSKMEGERVEGVIRRVEGGDLVIEGNIKRMSRDHPIQGVVRRVEGGHAHEGVVRRVEGGAHHEGAVRRVEGGHHHEGVVRKLEDVHEV